MYYYLDCLIFLIFYNKYCSATNYLKQNLWLIICKGLAALHEIYENNNTSTYRKILFLNSQTPRLSIFVLCFGFNQ